MKIDSNLRAAIRAAYAAQPKKNWEQKEKEIKEAAKKLVGSNPRWNRLFAGAIAKQKKADELAEEARKMIPDIGVSMGYRIHDREKFESSGGKHPVDSECWGFNVAMNELAACDPKDAPAILAKYGINWK